MNSSRIYKNLVLYNLGFLFSIEIFIFWFRSYVKVNLFQAMIIFNFFFLGLIIAFYLLDLKKGLVLNEFSGDRLICGIKGPLATLIDYYFVFLINWKVMSNFFPVLDFCVAEMCLALFVYFNFMIYFFDRTIGMMVVGLWLRSESVDRPKSNYWRRAIFLSLGPEIFYLLVLFLAYVFEWTRLFFKRDKFFTDYGSKTFLVRKKSFNDKGVLI